MVAALTLILASALLALVAASDLRLAAIWRRRSKEGEVMVATGPLHPALGRLAALIVERLCVRGSLAPGWRAVSIFARF
jgi:hypothetical protein